MERCLAVATLPVMLYSSHVREITRVGVDLTSSLFVSPISYPSMLRGKRVDCLEETALEYSCVVMNKSCRDE